MCKRFSAEYAICHHIIVFGCLRFQNIQLIKRHFEQILQIIGTNCTVEVLKNTLQFVLRGRVHFNCTNRLCGHVSPIICGDGGSIISDCGSGLIASRSGCFIFGSRLNVGHLSRISRSETIGIFYTRLERVGNIRDRFKIQQECIYINRDADFLVNNISFCSIYKVIQVREVVCAGHVLIFRISCF